MQDGGSILEQNMTATIQILCTQVKCLPRPQEPKTSIHSPQKSGSGYPTMLSIQFQSTTPICFPENLGAEFLQQAGTATARRNRPRLQGAGKTTVRATVRRPLLPFPHSMATFVVSCSWADRRQCTALNASF